MSNTIKWMQIIYYGFRCEDTAHRIAYMRTRVLVGAPLHRNSFWNCRCRSTEIRQNGKPYEHRRDLIKMIGVSHVINVLIQHHMEHRWILCREPHHGTTTGKKKKTKTTYENQTHSAYLDARFVFYEQPFFLLCLQASECMYRNEMDYGF